MDIASGVGEKLKLIRETNRMTQDQLSDKSGISQSQISIVESGNSNVGLNTLNILADALGVKLSDLINEYEVDLADYVHDKIEDKKEIFDEEMKNLNVYTSFYPSVKIKAKISTLLEFLVYLPLIEPRRLFDVLSRLYGDFNGQEEYIVSQLEYLVNSIPDCPAKDYADYVYEILQKRKDKRTCRISVSLEGRKEIHAAYMQLIERNLEFYRHIILM